MRKLIAARKGSSMLEDNLHRKFNTLLVSALLMVPVAISLFKISFAAYSVPLADFGRYSLYLSISAALVYVFNSGLYEGHLNYFSKIILSKRANRIKWLQARAELVSFYGLAVVLLIASISLAFFPLDESSFILALVFGAHLQAHSNLVTAQARVEQKLLRVGVILTFRAVLSTLIFVGLIIWKNVSIGTAYLAEGMLITICHAVYLAARMHLWNFPDFSRVWLIARLGVWQCYASSVRLGIFALERLAASFLLTPIEMGIYGRILISYQVMVVSGGIVAQILQQKVLYSVLSGSVRKTGVRIFKYQSAIILTVIFLISTVWMLGYFDSITQLFIPIDSGASSWALISILIAGAIMGTSLNDSLALGSSRGRALVIIQLASGVLWCVALLVVSKTMNIWSINLQATMYLSLIVFYFFGSVCYVMLHKQ